MDPATVPLRSPTVRAFVPAVHASKCISRGVQVRTMITLVEDVSALLAIER